MRGPVPATALGITLMHEHLFVLDLEIRSTYNDDWDEARRVSEAIDRLREAKAAGVSTIVDVTVIGLGRYIPRVLDIARQVEINIIAATGLYSYGELPLYMRGPRFGPQSNRRMTDVFVRDIREGIGDTGVRAAILKCATDHLGMTPGLERLFAAVAEAQKETRVPITTHTNEGEFPGGALQQQQFLLKEGVEPDRIILGHVDDSPDVDYLEELLKNGSYLSMDHLHGPPPSTDHAPPTEAVGPRSIAERIETIAALCERGYAKQLVLSHDNFCFAEVYGNLGLDFAVIPTYVVPRLRARGVSEDDITDMLVGNPARIFGDPDGT
jgi:phosphotriesterase-related protein